MTVIGEGARIQSKNILYLTDFSEPSKAAVPFAAARPALTAPVSTRCMC